MFLIRFSLLASLLLTSCAHAPVDPDELNCSNVKEGMGRAQVLEVLGSPDSSEKCGKEEMLSWDGIRVAFSNDVVVNKFETDEAFFFKINVKSVVAEIPKAKTAVIAPRSQNLTKNSVEFNALWEQVGSILEHKGYRVVEHEQDAKVVVYVESSIVKTLSNKIGAPLFIRNFVMNAVSRDLPGQDYWTVSLSSEGKSSNLRAALPYLVVASEEFIEKTAHDSKTFVFQNDPRVKAMSTRTPSSTLEEP